MLQKKKRDETVFISEAELLIFFKNPLARFCGCGRISVPRKTGEAVGACHGAASAVMSDEEACDGFRGQAGQVGVPGESRPPCELQKLSTPPKMACFCF